MTCIGLFGGTFNPIHLGHLRTVWEVHQAFGLHNTCLIPAAIPPHKPSADIADARHRLEMVRLAVSQCPDLLVSDVELNRPGPSFTIDTIQYFKTQLYPGAEFRFIVGMDAFLEIDSWKSYRQLLTEVPIIVVMRPARGLVDEWDRLDAFLKKRLSRSYRFCEPDRCYLHDRYQPIYLFNATLLDISATKIRQQVQSGQSIRFLVPDAVEHYIYSKGLYQ